MDDTIYDNYKNKVITCINDAEDNQYNFFWLFSPGDWYLYQGYKLNELKNIKDEYNSLLNEYKDRITIFLKNKKMVKIFNKISPKKYNNDILILKDIKDDTIEQIYLTMFKNDNKK